MIDDQDLADRLRGGNRETFESVFAEHSRALRSFVSRYLRNADAAADVTQETFLALWRNPRGFDPAKGSLRQYLFGIARRRAADWRANEPAPSTAAVRDAGVAGADQSAMFRQAFDRLDANERAVLWLRDAEGHSYAELAAIFDVPIGTIRSRLFYARLNLRTIWETGQARDPGRRP